MSQFYELVTPGPIPVTLSEAKCHLKVTTELDDDFLTALLEAATQSAEKYLNRDLRANSWRLLIDCFESRIELRKGPVAAVSEVARSVSSTFTAVSATVYYLKLNRVFSEVLLADGEEWPDDVDEIEAGIRILFTTRADPCVTLAKQGIARHAAFMYENRGDCDPANATDSIISSGAAALYDQMRIPRV